MDSITTNNPTTINNDCTNFVTASVLAVIIKVSSLRMRRLSRAVQGTFGGITHVAQEAIDSYRAVRIFGGSEYENKKFQRATKRQLRFTLKNVVTKALNVSAVQITAACALAFTVHLATAPGSQNMLSAGEFVSMIAAMLALLKPMKELTTVNGTIQRGLAGAQSIFALLDEELEEDSGTVEVERVQGDIEFNQVNFSYRNDALMVLKNISFSAKSGQTIALVGRSGGGKSTLMSLLSRFYEVTDGEIKIDGINIQDYTLKSLRNQFALVSQHVTLFNDTIAKNIAYGSSADAGEEAVIQAAEAAYAMDFIRALPEGLQTMVGENGVLLSGGQRQRLAIARAILKDAPILIFDEATSALDTESERFIQAALEKLMKNRTTFIIAHRLSTIENADVIMVIDDGKIVETGSHQELLYANGYYAKLHGLQFNEQTAFEAVPVV